MKVIWTQEALERLADIEAFISQDSPYRAENFINFLIRQSNSISENPQIGRIVPLEFLNCCKTSFTMLKFKSGLTAI